MSTQMRAEVRLFEMQFRKLTSTYSIQWYAKLKSIEYSSIFTYMCISM